MKSTFVVLLALALLASCGMNGLFLHPFELTPTSTFKQYDADVDDTLQLHFDETGNPKFEFLYGNPYNPGYTINSTFFKNREDQWLNAWIIEPDVPNGTSIFFLHGNAGNVVYNYQLAIPFVERGYKVFLMDYSEFGFSKGKATRKTVLQDALTGFDYFMEQETFKNDRIVIYGQSLGGHLASVVGTIKQDSIDGLIVEGAFNCHKDIAADRVPVLARIFVAEQYSGEDTIPQLNKPLLVIHSIHDTTVPIEFGQELYNAANEPKSFLEIDSMHVRGPLYYADTITARMEQMLK